MAQVAISHGVNTIDNIKLCIQELGGIEKFVQKNSTVFIKPDLSLPIGPPITVSPQIIGYILKGCREAGAKKIYIGFNPFDGISSKQLLKLLGLDDYFDKMGATILALENESYFNFKLKDSNFFKNLLIPEKLMQSDIFISLIAPRTDLFGQISLGLNNYFDLLSDAQKLPLYKTGSLLGLLDFYEKFPPHLAIWDAMSVGEGQSPFDQNARAYNLILGSTDLLVGDSLIAQMMGFDPKQIEYFQKAISGGFKLIPLSKIESNQLNLAQYQKNIQKPTLNFEDISQWIKIVQGESCHGCNIFLRYILDFLLRFISKDLREYGGVSIFIGKFPDNSSFSVEQTPIIFGNCAISSNLRIKLMKNNSNKRPIFKFPGCPPLNLRNLEKFSLDFKKEVPSLEFIEELIRRWTIGRQFTTVPSSPKPME